MTNKSSPNLTIHEPGSTRELWSLSFPLMVSMLSGALMLLADRIILAQYSTAAMNAAVSASMFCMIAIYGTVAVASIAEVFVGQHNGSGNQHKVGRPVWQMAWFSALTALVLWPIAWFAGPYVLADYYYNEFGLPYFQWLLLFGPIFPAVAAFSGFFVGVGKTRIVMVATVVGNVVNIGLDIILVFGWGPIPSMAASGAAVATGMAQSMQLGILLFGFLIPALRTQYGTLDWKLRPKILWNCLRVGGPNAIGHMIEITAWALAIRMAAEVGEVHMAVAAIGGSMYNGVAFVMEGLSKGLTTVAANFIGAKRWDLVKKSRWAAVKILLYAAFPIGLFLLAFPEISLGAFVSDDVSNPEQLMQVLVLSCFWIWTYFLLDGLTWLNYGTLTAAGDTMFVMWANALNAWLFALAPMYVVIIMWEASPMYFWMIASFYGSMNLLFSTLRLSGGKWKERTIETTEEA